MFYFLLSGLFTAFLCVSPPALFVPSHSVSHKVRCGVYTAVPALHLLLFSPRLALFPSTCTTPSILVSSSTSFIVSFSCAPSLAPYFFLVCLSVVSQRSSINLVYCSHHLSFKIPPPLLFSHHFLLSLPLSFSIPGTVFSSHTFIATLQPPPNPPHSPPLLHHFGIPRLSLVSSFHPSVLLAHFLSSFLPDSCSASQTNGGKYGNVSVTRRGIREHRVNMEGLSRRRQHMMRVFVCTCTSCGC